MVSISCSTALNLPRNQFRLSRDPGAASDLVGVQGICARIASMWAADSGNARLAGPDTRVWNRFQPNITKEFRAGFGHTLLSIQEETPWDCRRLVVGSGMGALPVMKEVGREAVGSHTCAVHVLDPLDELARQTKLLFHRDRLPDLVEVAKMKAASTQG